MKINIAFYSPAIDQGRSTRYKNTKLLMVNPTPYYLHGYFRKNYPEHEDKIKWLPSLLRPLSTSELALYCISNDVKILCVSLYIWNIDNILRVIKNLNEEISILGGTRVKIVAGGPSCDLEQNHDFIDHVIVGQGEKAWSDLLLDYLEISKLTTEASNIVHLVRDNKQKIYNFEFIRNIHYSPYLECEDLIEELLEIYQSDDVELGWPYETQRGCPYRCTFCDWNGGQSNKTQKRKNVDFNKELDFFAKHKIYSLHLSDANFGMWDVDVDIMKKFVSLKRQGHPFKFISYNLSKIINDNHKNIMKLIIENGFETPWIKLSAQDVHEDILATIERPGMWIDIKNYGRELYSEYYDTNKIHKIWIELIIGMPGQTVERWITTLDEIYSNGFIPRTYQFLDLKGAPVSYNKEYRKLHRIKSKLIYEVLDMSVVGNSVEDVFNNQEENFKFQIVTCTKTFTENDFVKMSMIDQLYRCLFLSYKFNNYGLIDINWKWLKPIIQKFITTVEFEKIYEKRCENFSKYHINAMDDCFGNIMCDGRDIKAIVGKNFNIIDTCLDQSLMSIEHKKILMELWESYKQHSILISHL
jgi:putative methyltransferase